MRDAGMVQIALSKSISSHVMPSVSLVRAQVRTVICSAFDGALSISASLAMKAGTSLWAIALWWPREPSFFGCGNLRSSQFFHRAGFGRSSGIQPSTCADAEHRLDAASQAAGRLRLVVPDRRQTASTSAVVISLTGFERIGAAYLRRVITHCCVMLRVLPPALVQPDVLVGAFAEGRRAALHRLRGLGLGPVADRVDASGHVGHPPLVADARLIERQFG